MSDREIYYEQARSWAEDTRVAAARSRGTAWTVAGIAVAVAAFEAVALALLMPLKTVQPITILVDRQTGFVQALDPVAPRRVNADAALTDAFLAQYVAAREGFDRATIQADYRRVALWSAGPARSAYLAALAPGNPASPVQAYRAGAVVRVRIKSVSRLSPGVSLVRFDTVLQSRDGRSAPSRPWISVLRFRYSDAPMPMQDRLVNPLGFQVASYRRDAEAAEQSSSEPLRTPAAQLPAPVAVITHPPQETPRGAPDSRLAMVPPRPVATQREHSFPSEQAARRIEVPINQIPLGSPLEPRVVIGDSSGAVRP